MSSVGLSEVVTRAVGIVGLATTALVGTLPNVGGPGDPIASAAPNDIIAVVIEGTGFGHGRGMSQWGAFGYAVDHGWNWNQILNHYYGGTEAGTVGVNDRIRVRLTKLDGLDTLGVVSYGSPVTWNGVSRASMYAKETSAGTFEIYGSTERSCPGASTLTVPPGTFSLLGTTSTGAGNPVQFTIANGDNPSVAPDQVIGVCQTDRSIQHYRGRIDVLSTSSGNRVVNDVRVEDYLRGVVPKEISALWANAGNGNGANAVRAQAVAARSYGLQQARSYYYDGTTLRYATTCDTTSCQVYGGAATRSNSTSSAVPVEHALTDAAVLATAGVVRRWPAGHARAGQLVSTEFSASNGPRTAGGEFPPVDDVGDATARNPNHRWTRILDADALESRYGLGQLTSVTSVDPASGVLRAYDGIWFNDVELTGVNGSVRIPAWTFRGTHGLPSPGFTVRVVREDASSGSPAPIGNSVRANTSSRSIAFVGNSVGASVASGGTQELDRLIDGTFASATIRTISGRCTVRTACRGLSGVQEAASLPAGLDLVVVELGYNDFSSTFSSDIDAMMAALEARGARQVAWVNMADIRRTSYGSRYASMNADLVAAAARWPTLKVLDWNAASSSAEARARWFTDGVHLTATGQAQFALWLRDAMVANVAAHYLAPPQQIRLPIVGQQVVRADGSSVTIPSSASAVAINVTTVFPARPGVVTVWPCATSRQETSNLNNMGNDIVANNVIASVDSSGEICLWSNVGTDIIVDINGWFDGTGQVQNPAGFVAVSPERIVDTRRGFGAPQQRVSPASPLQIDIASVVAKLPDGTPVAVPDDIESVVLNITSVNATGNGYFTVWPCALQRQETSSLNFTPGRVVANGIVSAVDENGKICVYAHAPSDLVIDVQGWFGASSSVFRSLDPTRIVDTRIGLGANQSVVQPAAPLTIPMWGRQVVTQRETVSVPTTATAVVLNVVAVDTHAPGFVTVWPCNGSRPTASNLNYVQNQIVANGIVAPIGSSGNICLYTHGAADIVVDIAGWMSSGYNATTPQRLVDTRYDIGPAPS